MESKACAGCAKARRRCEKQRPSCIRCRTRGTACRYPPSKPSSFVAMIESCPDRFDMATPVVDCMPPTLSLPFDGVQLESWWFASPDTWQIEHVSTSVIQEQQRFAAPNLDRLLSKIVSWLTEWVEQGSNPFIHQQLYRWRLPQCMQDAYLSLSAYLHKTASNEYMLYRIIEDRVTELVAEGAPSPNPTLDLLEYLARVQALLVYQCICMYDSNTRLRYLAEQHIPVLEAWMTDLVQHTKLEPSCGSHLYAPPDSTVTADIPLESLPWYSWIFIESTRRTWLVIAGVQGIYTLLQHRTTSCLGSAIFTSRKGFWEAPSAVVWNKRCLEEYAGLVRLTTVDKMLSMVPKGEISDFAKVVLECWFSVEQVEQWRV